VTKRVRWRTPHEWWDEKDREWVVGGDIRPKPGDILEYEMRDERLDIAGDVHRVEVAIHDGDLWIECYDRASGNEFCLLPMDKARQLRDWLNENVKD
jgi:hypothetical protein